MSAPQNTERPGPEEQKGPGFEENLKRLEGELYRFTQKFDHQSEGIPWESARDALPGSAETDRQDAPHGVGRCGL